MKFHVALFLASVALFSVVESRKTFTKCELVRALENGGIARSDIPDWICLVNKESSFRTWITNVNNNKVVSTDYGIFQINDRYWCKKGTAGGDCKIKCESLIDDDITDDIKCAKKVYARHNFNAWYGWKDYCKDKILPSITDC